MSKKISMFFLSCALLISLSAFSNTIKLISATACHGISYPFGSNRIPYVLFSREFGMRATCTFSPNNSVSIQISPDFKNAQVLSATGSIIVIGLNPEFVLTAPIVTPTKMTSDMIIMPF